MKGLNVKILLWQNARRNTLMHYYNTCENITNVAADKDGANFNNCVYWQAIKSSQCSLLVNYSLY